MDQILEASSGQLTERALSVHNLCQEFEEFTISNRRNKPLMCDENVGNWRSGEEPTESELERAETLDDDTSTQMSSEGPSDSKREGSRGRDELVEFMADARQTEELAVWKAETSRQSQELDVMTAELSRQSEELAVWKAETSRKSEELEVMTEELRRQMEELAVSKAETSRKSEELDDVTEEFEVSKAAASRLAKKMAVLERQYICLLDTLQLADRAISEQSTELTDLQQQTSWQQRELADAKSEVFRLTERLSLSQMRARYLSLDHSMTAKECVELRKQLAKTERSFKEMSGNLEVLIQANVAMRKRLRGKKGLQRDMYTTALLADRRQLSFELTMLERRNNELRRMLRESKDDNFELAVAKTKIHAMAQMIESAEKTIGRLKDDNPTSSNSGKRRTPKSEEEEEEEEDGEEEEDKDDDIDEEETNEETEEAGTL